MMTAPREFGALVTPGGVWVVEYRREREGYRPVGGWEDRARAATLDEALDRLLHLLAIEDGGKARLSIVLDQFGTFHHTMVLPPAPDEVIRPIIQREVQRTFGVADAVVAYVAGVPSERRDPPRADPHTAPRQVFIIGIARETLAAIRARLSSQAIELRVVTIVPVILRQLHQSTQSTAEPSAMLAVLESGPHLAYFLGGQLGFAVDPPIALEGESPSADLVVDQVDRGNVYFRQQFRGATITTVLVTARPETYERLVKALEARLGLRALPFVANSESPESLLAMGAALEADAEAPLTLIPRQPSLADRVRGIAAGTGALVAACVVAAFAIGLWCAVQFAQLSSARSELARSNARLQSALPRVEPLRTAAQRRADFVTEVSFLRATANERGALSSALADAANALPSSARADTIRISRTASGWSGSLVGAVTGTTTGEAVRSLNVLFESLRSRPAIASTVLDEFDYAGSRPQPDSTVGSRGNETAHPGAPNASAAEAPIVIRYRISFTLRKGVGS